jgi:protein O-GlcNAc transferase
LPQAIDQAIKLHQEGRLGEAERLYRDILRNRPRDLAALNLLGALKLQQDRPQDAVDLIRAAIEIDQSSEAAQSNLGLALAALKRPEEALASYQRALEINPRNIETLVNRGDALCDLGRNDEAIASYDRALAIHPGSVAALVNRGLALREVGRFAEALASYERALAADPRNTEAYNNRGVVLQDLDRHREALASYERAIALRPDYAEAMFNRGNVLLVLKRFNEALTSYAGALAARPNFAEAHCNRGHALADLNRFAEALASYEQAAAAKPDYLEALSDRAAMLAKLERHGEAIAEYERLLARYPAAPNLPKELLGCCTAVCQWSNTDQLAAQVVASAVGGSAAVDPFMLLGLEGSASSHLAAATNWLRLKKITSSARHWDAASFPTDRLRVAYLSADYHRHATAHLIAELLELHDRKRFEIIGISFGPDDRSELRSRLVGSFDRFFDVSTRTDAEAAGLVRDLKTHIAVDLKGYTQHSRIGIMAQRPAPIQASYLGYPGTSGADFIDYIIADKIVLPFDQAPFYTEKIIHLPDSYQVNDRKRPVGRVAARADVGLPAGAFVFCCFNNNWKFNPPMFDIWMRLLGAVEGSVLWAFRHHSGVAANLRKEAAARGIDPDRLVFAPPLDLPDHLARLELADLFLDTLPYNAHTTASDALWMGVPVVTCLGSTFAGRVAASLVHAAGLPQLATSTLDAYERLALELATDPELLRSVRGSLKEQRSICPLFDTDRFRRHIEAAYMTMWENWRRGETPRDFAVDPIDARDIQPAST